MSLFGKKQEMENNQRIRVFVRCRPLNAIERRNSSPSVVQCNSEKGEVTVKEKSADKVYNKIFTFDRVFDPLALQIEVYKDVASSLIDEVLMGYNCTVFVYGQTGTGKTYTMEGVNESSSWEKDPAAGIIPRAMHQLFESLSELSVEFSVRVSFLELYNEELFDLLSPSDIVKLKLFETTGRSKGSVLVQGLEEIVVSSKQEVYAILEKGTARRQTAATLLNATSSRSHTVFSVTVFIKDMNLDGEELLRIGKLNLVDLAGSENIGRSGAVDRRAREAGSINQSLLTLGRVITALVEKRPHIPYRGSKLTRILQDSLGGNAKTSIIATISPALCNIEETLSTLDYAYRAKNITNRPEINQRMTKRSLIKEYTEEIERLRRDLIASKEKMGIFMDENLYRSIQNRLLTKNDNARELKAEKEILQNQLEKIKSEYALIKEGLNLKHQCSMQQAKENAELEHKLEEIQEELLLTKKAEYSAALNLAELSHITEVHKKTEENLLHQSLKLLQINDQTSLDISGLHAKLKRVENMNINNEFKYQQCLRFYKEDLQKLLEITKDNEKCSISNTTAYIDGLLQEYDKIEIILASFFQGVINHHSTNFETLKIKIDKKAELIKQTQFVLQVLATDKDASNQNCSAYMKEFELAMKTSFQILSEQFSTICNVENSLETQTENLKKKLHHFALQQKDILEKISYDIRLLHEQEQRILINHQSEEKCMAEEARCFKKIYDQEIASLEEAVECVKTAYINHKKLTGKQWLQSQETINKMKELNRHNHLFSDRLSEMQEINECFKAECSTLIKDSTKLVEKDKQRTQELNELVLKNQEELKLNFTKYHKDAEKEIENCAEEHIKIITRNKNTITDCIEDCDKYIHEYKAKLPELMNTAVMRKEDCSHKFETCICNRKLEVDEVQDQLLLRVHSLKGKINEVNNRMGNYFSEELKEIQTGQTPESKMYVYSNSFAYTPSYAEILKQCVDKLPEQVNLITKLAEEKAAEDICLETSKSEKQNGSFELSSTHTPKESSTLHNSGVRAKLERSGPVVENLERITIREKSLVLRQKSNMSACSNSVSKRRFSRSNTQM